MGMARLAGSDGRGRQRRSSGPRDRERGSSRLGHEEPFEQRVKEAAAHGLAQHVADTLQVSIFLPLPGSAFGKHEKRNFSEAAAQLLDHPKTLHLSGTDIQQT